MGLHWYRPMMVKKELRQLRASSIDKLYSSTQSKNGSYQQWSAAWTKTTAHPCFFKLKIALELVSCYPAATPSYSNGQVSPASMLSCLRLLASASISAPWMRFTGWPAWTQTFPARLQRVQYVVLKSVSCSNKTRAWEYAFAKGAIGTSGSRMPRIARIACLGPVANTLLHFFRLMSESRHAPTSHGDQVLLWGERSWSWAPLKIQHKVQPITIESTEKSWTSHWMAIFGTVEKWLAKATETSRLRNYTSQVPPRLGDLGVWRKVLRERTWK